VEVSSFFGIKVLDEIHRAFDIGKQSSDSLALTVGRASGFPRCLLSHDPLGEVLGRVENRF
jgi:hypothetical protein